MRDTVFVFARAPRLGTVKRRLAAGIGDPAALRFYRATLAATLRRLRRDRRFATVLAITPDRARGPWRQGLPVVPQGSGDLGTRMRRALDRARRAAVVGSDIPDLRAEDVAAAFRALGRADLCFGPHALSDTLRTCAPCRAALLTRRLADIDTAADWRRWRGV